jgi:NarL family two-component system sensor histidine kinase LiaS
VIFFYTRGYLVWLSGWREGVQLFIALLGAVIVAGAGFGYWSYIRIQTRLEKLREAMLHLERGNLSAAIPPLGEDEIGRLAEQLNRISVKWEEQVSSLQRLSNHNARLAQQAKLSAVVEERQRLARELHDAVSQQLFAISMTATAVARTLDKDMEKARRQIHLIEEMASVAQSEMRALLLHLRPVHLEGKRLAEGLLELLHELRAKVPIELTWELDEELQLPRGIENHLFRIVQEALSNALRHAKATKLTLKLHCPGETIRLMIQDNGVGFDLNERKQTSYGLASMRERVNEIGGTLSIITAPGKGTRIDIRVPLLSGGEPDENAD